MKYLDSSCSNSRTDKTVRTEPWAFVFSSHEQTHRGNHVAEQEIRVRQEKVEAYLQEQDQVWRSGVTDLRGVWGCRTEGNVGLSPAGSRECLGEKRGANVGAGRQEGGAAGNNSFRFLLMSRPETLLFLPKEE